MRPDRGAGAPSGGWWLLNASVAGWMGGDAGISAAMPLQPSPGVTPRSVSPPPDERDLPSGLPP